MQLRIDPAPPLSQAVAGGIDPAPPRGMRLRALRHRSLAAGTAISILLVLLVAFAPLLTSIDPTAQDPAATFSPPSLEHPMGADAFGCDLFSRVLYGGRT